MQANNKKNVIIENAINLFYELGYKDCTLRKIAEASDISHVAILKHFQDKHELASILIDRYLVGLIGLTDQFIKQNMASSRDNFECILFWWCVHYQFLKRDKKFRKFYIGYYDYNYKSFNDIHIKYTERVFRELFKFKVDKPDLYRTVDDYALAAAVIELIKLYADNKLTYQETIEYLINFFVKLFDYNQKLSREEINAFIDRYIESDMYVRYEIFDDFLKEKTETNL